MVAFTRNGGTDQALKNSVIMLQANNIRINATTDDSCEFLHQTVQDWISTVFFTHHRRRLSLHLLHLTLEPVRCDILNHSSQICAPLCEPYEDIIECSSACDGWITDSEEERIGWYEKRFDVRPNNIVTMTSSVVPSNYSLPNGTLVEAEFYVAAQYNEMSRVQET